MEYTRGVVWSGNDRNFVAQPWHWPLATAGYYWWMNYQPWDVMADADGIEFKGMLEDAWDTYNRKDLLEQLHHLLIHGHRLTFRSHVDYLRALTNPELEAVRHHAQEQDDEQSTELLWVSSVVQANAYGCHRIKFSAWDLVRFIYLCRVGALVGYLTESEAMDFMSLACLQLRAEFSSWYDLGWHFGMGKWFWSQGQDCPEVDPTKNPMPYVSDLLKSRKGPWAQVPWNMPLPVTNWWLAPALHAEGIIKPLTDEQRTVAGQWEWMLDNALKHYVGSGSTTA